MKDELKSRRSFGRRWASTGFGQPGSMNHKVNWYIRGVVLVLVAGLTISCRSRPAAFDCNFQDWQGPSIVVGADDVNVVLFDDGASMPLDKLHDYLSELPNRYWGRGRVVSISEGGLRAPNTDDVIRANMKETKRIVESLGIQIKCQGRQVTAALTHTARPSFL